MTDDLKPFDFREIASTDDTAVAMRNWVLKSSSFFSDFWCEVSDFEAQITLGNSTTDTYDAFVEGIPRTNLACVTNIEGHFSSLWLTSPKDLRIISAEMLGLGQPEENDDDLTPVESSLSILFIEQLAQALSDGWMGAEPIKIEANDLIKDPRKMRAFRARDLIVKATIEVTLNAGQAQIHWLLAKDRISDLMDSVIDQRKREKPKVIGDGAVKQLPIEVVTLLGKAEIPVDQLTNLSAGEVIILDQRIDRPVTTLVNDTPYYTSWPGQVSNQQAVEIAECLGPEAVKR